MAKKPGSSAQIWCHTPLTHWMCNGYRFDLIDGVKVEQVCTCTCHGSGVHGIRGTSHAQNMVEDPHRFDQARLIGWELLRRSRHIEEEDYVGPMPEEVGGETQVRQARRHWLTVVAGPSRFPGILAGGRDLIARSVASERDTWTEIWDSEWICWLAVEAKDIPPFESGIPLTADEAARVDDGVPRKEP